MVKKRCRICGKRLGARNRGTICAKCRIKRKKFTKRDARTLDRFYKALKAKRTKAKRAEKLEEEGEVRARTRAEKLARRLTGKARKLKRELMRRARPTMRKGKLEKLSRQTSLNTWIKEDVKNRITAEFKIKKGAGPKGEDMYEERKTKRLYTLALVNRKMGALRYHAQVRFLHTVLGGSYAEARRAFTVFRKVGFLEKIEIES